jgi:hypothetical protein
MAVSVNFGIKTFLTEEPEVAESSKDGCFANFSDVFCVTNGFSGFHDDESGKESE